MVLASLKYGDPTKDALAARASAYIVPDILWSSYYDAMGAIPITEDFKVRLSGQFMVQGSTGVNLLTGHPFGTFTVGAKVDAIWGPIMLTGAFMQTGSAAEYRTPYGIFIGYNKQEVLDFDRAGERSFQIGATYDFKGVGLPGATFTGQCCLRRQRGRSDDRRPALAAVGVQSRPAAARRANAAGGAGLAEAIAAARPHRLRRSIPRPHRELVHGIPRDPELRSDVERDAAVGHRSLVMPRA